ncbi:hypothetical protein [Azonexus sp.]|jgi:hypothetical protein|nr:hypothetical protein [Azonexus sp.]
MSRALEGGNYYDIITTLATFIILAINFIFRISWLVRASFESRKK